MIYRLVRVFLLFFMLIWAGSSMAQVGIVDTLEADSLLKLAIKLRASKPDSAKALALSVLDWAEKYDMTKWKGGAYRAWGLAERYGGNLYEAERVQKLALGVFRQVGDSLSVAATFINLGNIYKRRGENALALECQLLALKMREEWGAEPNAIATCYNNIGNLYRVMGAYEDALSYHQQALALRLESGENKQVGYSYLNTGLVYYRMGNYDAALDYYRQALTIQKVEKNQREIATLYENIANVFYKRGVYDTTEVYYQKALEINQSIGNKSKTAITLGNLGLLSEARGNLNEAIDFKKDALVLAHEIGALSLEEDIHQDLALFYERQGRYDSAFVHFKQYAALRDSLVNQRSTLQINELRTKFETEQKEQEINNLLTKQRNQNLFRNWLIFGILLLLLLIIVIIRENYLRQKALERVERAQIKLVQSEKMASLGQLTAGIAHEINNPINFVASNVKALKMDFNDVAHLLYKVVSLDQCDDPQKCMKEIREMSKKIDLPYLQKEIFELVEGIERGARRTQDIVVALRTFSRDRPETFIYADIHSGLESALAILSSQLRLQIEVHKDYGEIPPVKCQFGKLNQVFLNIINNAIQAIGEEGGNIYLTTRKEDDWVEVSIRDDGKGMDEETMSHIFNPFFTTKDVGEGTGLGLSISYGIIEEHRGNIQVESQPGEGANFILRLPIEQPDKPTTV